MTKEDISKLQDMEQSFIYENGLQDERIEDVRWLEENYDYAVYNGWL